MARMGLALILSFLALKPLKKIFSAANYKAFPALSLNAGLDHCALCQFLLRECGSEAESAEGRSRS